jgi:hypothetical protein
MRVLRQLTRSGQGDGREMDLFDGHPKSLTAATVRSAARLELLTGELETLTVLPKYNAGQWECLIDLQNMTCVENGNGRPSWATVSGVERRAKAARVS